MSLGDRKTLDRYRNQLLCRAEAIQRRLDEVTRAAREELVSINDEIRALDSTRETLKEDGERRASFLDRRSRVTKKVKTVLIVEKNPNYTQSLVTQIRFAGLKPIVAVTGEGGLRMAEDCEPDLILFDVEQLPDMNGLRFVSEIRRNPEADRVPIVAMSALPDLKAGALSTDATTFC